MTRLVTSLGTLIALMTIAPAAEAGSYAFSIGGHRFQVESPRNCRSASCVSVSSNRSFRPDVDTTPAPPPAVVAPRPEIKQAVTSPARSDDEPAYLPLGEWESAGARGTVRIERCGPALCGYALTEASSRGESVLVNMKPKTHDVWTGNIYSRSSGSTYYATMTLQNSGKLHVEACALGHFWCSGNDWTRAEERAEKLITTSRQASARS